MTMLTGYPRTRWPRRRFSENYAVRICVKITRICEFRVIMGTMTDLLGWCSSSTLASRANYYVKTLATLGFWLHHSPCPFGCSTNNTLAARPLSPNHFRRYISRSSVWSASDVATYSMWEARARRTVWWRSSSFWLLKSIDCFTAATSWLSSAINDGI